MSHWLDLVSVRMRCVFETDLRMQGIFLGPLRGGIHSMHTYIHTYIHTYNAYTHAYMHTYIHTCMHAYIHTYMHTYTHTHTHTHTHKHTRLASCMSAHATKHTHTHTHTAVQRRATYSAAAAEARCSYHSEKAMTPLRQLPLSENWYKPPTRALITRPAVQIMPGLAERLQRLGGETTCRLRKAAPPTSSQR